MGTYPLPSMPTLTPAGALCSPLGGSSRLPLTLAAPRQARPLLSIAPPSPCCRFHPEALGAWGLLAEPVSTHLTRWEQEAAPPSDS